MHIDFGHERRSGWQVNEFLSLTHHLSFFQGLGVAAPAAADRCRIHDQPVGGGVHFCFIDLGDDFFQFAFLAKVF